MPEPLDEQYLRWLYARIGSVRDRSPSRTYWNLLKNLYSNEFVWIIRNDDNRIEDGRDLRLEFLAFKNRKEETVKHWLDLEVSVLEVIMALTNHMDFETGEGREFWFWQLMKNLGLDHKTDALYLINPHEENGTNEVVYDLIWRLYNPDGSGGLFPLQHAQEDQRRVELWYQMSSYILERM